MEVQDGFIDGIFNYCDRWCEPCAFTSWCRLFAAHAEADASLDPHLKAITEAPPLRHEIKEIPEWLEELLEQAQNDIDKMTDDELEEMLPPPINKDDPLLQRAHAYSMRVHDWSTTDGRAHNDPTNPRAVIAWFSTIIPAKIARALHGIGMADMDDPDEPTDHDGSAKVALVSIERSRAAWQLIAVSEPSSTTAAPAIADLTWLEQEIERMFPRARRFVRPAFDEPDEVARLLAEQDSS
jgi:hypothetical protein